MHRFTRRCEVTDVDRVERPTEDSDAAPLLAGVFAHAADGAVCAASCMLLDDHGTFTCMQDRARKMTASTVTGTMAAFAQMIEAAADSHGWDQPATLWGVSMPDLPDDVESEIAKLVEQTSATVAVPWELSQLAVLDDGHPADALVAVVAPDDVVAVMLCSEGWGYSAPVRDEIERSRRTPEYPPADDPNRVELRWTQIVMRDGTEVVVCRERGSEPEMLDDAFRTMGRLPERLRRVIGLPSGMDEADFPTPEQVRVRLRAQQVLRTAVQFAAVEPGVADAAVATLCGAGTAGEWQKMFCDVGLVGDTWSAVREYAAGVESQFVDAEARAFFGWCDAPMTAEHFDSNVASSDDLARAFRGFPGRAQLRSQTRSLIGELIREAARGRSSRRAGRLGEKIS